MKKFKVWNFGFSVKASRYKFLLFDITKQTNNFIKILIKWNTKCDNAGFHIKFQLYGFSINLSISDIRKWNLNKNRWHDCNEYMHELYINGVISYDDYTSYVDNKTKKTDIRHFL